MSEHSLDLGNLLWFAGWLVAVGALLVAGLAIPLQTRSRRGWMFAGAVVAAAVAVTVVANVALVLHDNHIDLTREKVFTPSGQAMRVVDNLQQEVKLTYFYRSQDPAGRRTKDILEIMGRRNPLLKVTAVDPDKEPTLAQTAGIRLYNAAMLEAQGRRVLVQGTDEAEIAIGIQRVLRERIITVCFIEGHNELPMDNFEYHTHLEGVSDHSHGDAASKLVQTPGHGVGRMRRALEAQGYEVRKIILATLPAVPEDCAVVVTANPRNTFVPAESAALRHYLQQGGSAFFMFDLGFVLEPGLAALVEELGVRPEQKVVVDPLAHYSTDPEMVAVAGYDPHPVTKPLSMTFFPGVRPLAPVPPAAGVKPSSLLASSRDSYTRNVPSVESRQVQLPAASAAQANRAQPEAPGPRLLGVAVEGELAGGSKPFRAVIIGDGDFASNSFFPFMSNSDLALSAVRWLAHEERGQAVSSRIPVPPTILLTASQMQLIFLVLVVLLPLAVVAAGTWVWWKRR
jgi:hypothetical protein